MLPRFLSTFMVNDLPDRFRFLKGRGQSVAAAAKVARGKSRVAAVGEWRTCCGYKARQMHRFNRTPLGRDSKTRRGHSVRVCIGRFSAAHRKAALEKICAEHSAVCGPSEDDLKQTRPPNDDIGPFKMTGHSPTCPVGITAVIASERESVSSREYPTKA